MESPALSGTSGNGAPELDSAFSGRSDPRSARSDIASAPVELVDVAPFVGLEAGVDEGEALRVLRVVARELGVSERELAERLTGQRPTSDGGKS